MINIQVKGISNVIARMNMISKDTKQAVDVALQEGGLLIQEEIQNSIDGQRAESRSVDTGAFLNSINLELAPNGIAVYSDAEYAKYLEYGTSRMEERRHFRNSFARVKPIVIQRFKAEINKAVK